MSFLRHSLFVCRAISSLTRVQLCARRNFSFLSEHRVLPATLIRLNAGRISNLYQRGSGVVSETRSLDDAVTVSEDGFVRQFYDMTVTSSSNGALLMPNTFTMQELIRMSVDQYFECKDAGILVDTPTVFTFAKGTKVPKTLSLLREQSAQFSLQPREPMTLAALNEALMAFYKQHGKEEVADSWLDEHEYRDAFNDDEEDVWKAA